MKRMTWMFLMLLLATVLSGCGIFDRGNYEKDRDGYTARGDYIVRYHTNAVGEIDVFLIDRRMSFFQALDYTGFDPSQFGDDPVASSVVSPAELTTCGVDRDEAIPRFIRIQDKTYYYRVRDSGECSFDEYVFDADGFTEELIYDVSSVSPIAPTDTTRFRIADFLINPFQDILVLETIHFDMVNEQWVKTSVGVLPMSYAQAGDVYENLSDEMEELRILERYVLANQSINLLRLVDDYQSEDVITIWTEDTIEAVGRNEDVIKNVRGKQTGEVLDLIHDTLAGLGMFQ